MEQSQGWNVQRTELLGAVRGARLRWRLRRALLGGALAITGSVLVLTLLAYTLDKLAYGDTSVIVSQVIALAVILALFWFLLVRPLLPRPTDAQMAHFIEEHEPSLDAALLTAVELDAREKAMGGLGRSPALASRLFQNARERIRKIDDARSIDRGALQGSAAAFAVAATLAFLVALMGPPVLKHGIKLLLTPWDRAQPASLYAIMVEPGNATIARGGDQLISAKLYNFQSDSVDLLVRRSDSTGWTRVAMMRDTASAAYTFRLLDVIGAMDYVVESNGIRSRPYRLDVADLPYTKSMRLELRYPAYTQLAPRVIDGGGDIAALAGTTVRVQVTPTRPAASGLLVMDNGDTISLRANPDGTLSGTMRVTKPGFYKVQLRAADGRLVPASLEYTIDVLPDRPPTVEFTKPGRDTKVLAVDEVYSEVHAQDDYGVAKVELVYSVNGSPERSVPLQEGTMRALTDVSAGHTFMLEEYQLQPGDVVSYYARAVDNNAATGAQTASTDIYFLQVRPYDQDYRQQQGGGGGGGGQGEEQNQLSQQQREIIAGTFKTSRDKAKTPPKELEENLATLRLSQQRLREQVEELARKLVSRGVAGQDSNFKKIAEILPKAAAIMDTAEKSLASGDPQQALAPEQRALQQLQRAEAIYKEISIQQGGGGGGGGGGQGQRAEDLADLFEMNRDKLRNQYESVQRGQQEQQQRNQQVDETLERLKKLAARQQQENERAQRKADSMSLGQSGSGGGGSQRQMAQEAEQAARQLERLAREQNSRELADAARRLQDAADAMRRAAASGQQGGAEGRAAAEQLDRARRLLEQEKSGRADRDVDNLREQARRIAEQEKQIQSDVNKLGDENGRAQRAQSIAQQKADQANAMRNLKSQLERMSLDNRRDQKEASQQLADAAQALRDRKTEEKIRASGAQIQYASPEYAKAMEESIGSDIADLGQRLDNASKSAAKGTEQGQREAQALDRTRDLVNGMESLADRMRQRQEASSGRRLGQGLGAERDSSRQGGQANAMGQQQPGGRQGQGQQSQNQQGQGQNQQGQGQQQNGAQNGQRGQQGQQGQGQGQGQGQNQSQSQQSQGQQGQGQAQGGGNGQQNGQQGGRNGQGGQPQDGRMQGGMNGGAPSNANGGRLSQGDARQFSRELRERLADAQQLRDDLKRQGMDVAELDRAIQGMRSLADENLLMDANAAAMLKAQIVDGLKGFEFDLRRSLGLADKDRVLLGRSGDVPEAYRQFVEDYYKSLAGGKKKNK